MPKMAEKLAKFAKIMVFEPLVKFEWLVSVGNHFKWIPWCFYLSLSVLIHQKGLDFLNLGQKWPKNGQNLLKSWFLSLWLKVIEWLVLVGNHFKWLPFCSFSSLLVLNVQKGLDFLKLGHKWPKNGQNFLKSWFLSLWSNLSG